MPTQHPAEACSPVRGAAFGVDVRVFSCASLNCFIAAAWVVHVKRVEYVVVRFHPRIHSLSAAGKSLFSRVKVMQCVALRITSH